MYIFIFFDFAPTVKDFWVHNCISFGLLVMGINFEALRSAETGVGLFLFIENSVCELLDSDIQMDS